MRTQITGLKWTHLVENLYRFVCVFQCESLTISQPTLRQAAPTGGKTSSPAPLHKETQSFKIKQLKCKVEQNRTMSLRREDDGRNRQSASRCVFVYLRRSPWPGRGCQTSGHVCSSPLGRSPTDLCHLHSKRNQE